VNCEYIPVPIKKIISLFTKAQPPDQGKSVTVTVVDRCAGCAGTADLDLSPTAFSQLANESVGRLHNAEWNYV
jgi:expansin (peptidoglycan-binding protein)